MALRVPAGVSLLLGRLHTYRWSLVGAGIIGGVVLLKMWPGALPQAHTATVAADRVPQMRSTVNARQSLEAQVEEEKTARASLEKNLQALQALVNVQTRKAEDAERVQREDKAAQAAHAQAQQKQFEEALTRTRASQQATPVARSAPVIKKVVAETPPVAVPQSALFELRTMHPDANKKRIAPPLANDADQAYLPLGCHAAVQVVTGVMATSQVNGGAWGHPVLMVLTNAFNCPWHLGDPGQRPTPSRAPLDGCFAIGKAVADMSSQRANIAVELLSCVFPDGSSYEQAVEGWVVDQDGTQGIVGEYHTYESAKIAKAALAGIIQEASTAFGYAKSKVLIAGTGGAQPFGTVDTTFQQIGALYVEQARALLPTLWVHSNTPAYMVLRKGVPLKGYPVVALLGGGK